MKHVKSGRWYALNGFLAMLVVAIIITCPLAATGNHEIAPSWRTFYEGAGGVVYAFSPASIVRAGDRVEVRVRSIDKTAPSADETTMVVHYRLDCKQRTFTVLGEEGDACEVACGPAPDEILIRPQKHKHLEQLRSTVCPGAVPPKKAKPFKDF